MFTKKEIVLELKKQLAIDFNCKFEDFDNEENILTLSAKNDGRRVYNESKAFFSMATMGKFKSMEKRFFRRIICFYPI